MRDCEVSEQSSSEKVLMTTGFALLFLTEPSSSPSIVKASSNSSTTIYVEWSPIPQHLIHGILLGYNIHYSNLDPERNGHVSTGSHPTGPTNSSTLIKSLFKFTSYRIRVSAFTVKGDGPLSDAVIVRTDEDGKGQCLVDIRYLFTEWEGRKGKYLTERSLRQIR